ncbi:hypothetical protein ES708_24514 [subsurface metagenome]
MAKPKSPLLSLGARGTIADGLTFQKRGRGTIAREKPIPKDPRSAAQLAWRQKYRDAVAAWHALTPEEKEAWHGVCPGLTGYQCFMSSELKYVPVPIPIDIGSGATPGDGPWPRNYTSVDKDNPANASGMIKTVEIYASGSMEECFVGTFYTTNGNTLKCRDSVALGRVDGGVKTTWPGLSLAVEAGDYIGMFFTTGSVYYHPSGYTGLWYKLGEYIDPGDEAIYTLLDGYAISLYGTGEGVA